MSPGNSHEPETAMSRYDAIARFFHWSIAGLIVSQYGLAELAQYAQHQDKALEQLALWANHKSVGITILVLALMRLIYRLVSKAPALPSTMPLWQKTASHVSHGLLYILLFAMPITGMSSAKAYSVSWFNLFALPDFVSPNKPLAETLHLVHQILAQALFVVALIHILAALKHYFFDKDEVLQRMASLGNWALFICISFVTVLVLGRFFTSATGDSDQKLIRSNEEFLTISKSGLALWKIDYENSFIKFSGEQAGAPFTGEWKVWSADIQFDANKLNQSRFNVSIDTNSGFSNDTERDDTMRSNEFFDVAQFKVAKYIAQNFSKTENKFQSQGQLTIKGIASSAILTFDVREEDGKLILAGTAPLDRFLWNIGTGDWLDTSWVGRDVLVEVRVQADRN